ncbi:MAG: FtsQ-type POTRA domain-containing protein [Chloroflexota bacterium]
MSGKPEPTRAELVRMRREQERAKHLQRASKVAERPVVVTRARKDITKPVRKPARNARRRFQIAIPHLPRAAAPAFSLPRPRMGWRWFSFLLTAVLGSLLYLAFTRPELRVTEAQLTGSRIVTQAELNAVLGVSGQPIFLLDPSDLETRLRLAFPEFVSVRVSVSLPNLISVSVTERQPLIRWEQGGGYTWIAEDGVAFRPRGELDGLISVVALSAPPAQEANASDPLTPAPFISAEMIRALKALAAHVPAGTPILYERESGFGWNDPRGWRVYFGVSAGDVELKVRVYEAMVNALTQKGIRPALVNVVYPTAPYYRLSE